MTKPRNPIPRKTTRLSVDLEVRDFGKVVTKRLGNAKDIEVYRADVVLTDRKTRKSTTKSVAVDATFVYWGDLGARSQIKNLTYCAARDLFDEWFDSRMRMRK